jgi:hypothetical protein
MKYLFAVFLMLIPVSAQAFSDSFKRSMTELQTRVMYRGQNFSAEEIRQCWDKFDEEVVSLLSQFKTEEELNKEGAPVELTFLDEKKGEKELIELGTIEAKFYKLGSAWVVGLNTGMTVGPSNTFHIYQNREGKFVRTASFEEISGPWDRDRLMTMVLQIQVIRRGGKSAEFATYHRPYRARSNRSQIVWKYDGKILIPTYWIPEVDWHTVGDQQVAGRGEVFIVAPQ